MYMHKWLYAYILYDYYIISWIYDHTNAVYMHYNMHCVCSSMEQHAFEIVPWRCVCHYTGAVLKSISCRLGVGGGGGVERHWWGGRGRRYMAWRPLRAGEKWEQGNDTGRREGPIATSLITIGQTDVITNQTGMNKERLTTLLMTVYWPN